MIRLGVHAQSGEHIREMQPGIVHWCDYASPNLMAYVRNIGGLNVARRWVSESELWARVCEDAEAAAWWYWDQWLQRFRDCIPHIDYVIGGNEIFGADKPQVWQMEAIHKFEMTMMAHAHYAGLKYASDSWPSGNIELAQWEYLYSLCQRDKVPWHGDAISLHEYWRTPAGPRDRQAGYDPEAPYLIGRFFHYRPLPPVPVIITEMGYDNYQGGEAKHGFSKDYLMSDRDAVYASHLQDYCRLIDELAEQHQVTVIGATVFTSGRNAEWTRKGFDITGVWQIEQAIRDWPKEHTVYKQEEPVYEFELGFAEYAATHPEVGEAAGPLQYDAHGNATQQTSNGWLVWWRGANWIGFAPFGQPLPNPPVAEPEPAPLVRAMDVSSYQPTDLTALIQEHHIEHVIVRLYQPNEQPSQDVTREQIASARTNGCTVGGYMWLYADWESRQQVRDVLALARECNLDLPVLWIDYEPYTDDTMPTLEQLREAIIECRALGVRPGIYTGGWCWIHGDVLTDVPLWAAQYDGIPDPDVFTPFGGWTQCAIKQYSAEGIDLNIARREYTVPAVVPQPPEPEPGNPWMERALRAEAERDRYKVALENIRVQTEVLG